MSQRVHIVGAGFSGLTAAYYLKRSGFDVIVYEREARTGGLIQSKKADCGLVETAANAILNSDLVEDLASELNIKLQRTNPKAKKRFIFRAKPKRWPLTVSESLGMGVRLLKHFLKGTLRPREDQSETISIWGNRVLGEFATENLLAPALAGIYAGDPSRMDAGLVLGPLFARKKDKSTVVRGSVTPLGGMGEWIEKLTDHLEAQGVAIHRGREFDWSLKERSDFVVVATGLKSATDLLREKAPKLAASMDRLECLPVVSVTCFFAKAEQDITGFGCLFAPEENFNFLGVLFNSDIFPNRSDGYRSETWIGGGAAAPSLIKCTDRDLLIKIRQDRERMGEKWSEPKSTHVNRWDHALPHFTNELRRLIQSEELRKLEEDRVFLHGNYLGRIGLSNILNRSHELGSRIGSGK